MATVVVDGVSHTYVDNPVFSGATWQDQYPPIPDEVVYAKNPVTGQIFELTDEMRRNWSYLLVPCTPDEVSALFGVLPKELDVVNEFLATDSSSQVIEVKPKDIPMPKPKRKRKPKAAKQPEPKTELVLEAAPEADGLEVL